MVHMHGAYHADQVKLRVAESPLKQDGTSKQSDIDFQDRTDLSCRKITRTWEEGSTATSTLQADKSGWCRAMLPAHPGGRPQPVITQVPNLLLMKRPAIADPKATAKPKAGAQKKPAAAPKAPTPEDSDNSKLFIIIFNFWLPLACLLIEEAPGITNHICRILLLRRVLQMS